MSLSHVPSIVRKKGPPLFIAIGIATPVTKATDARNVNAPHMPIIFMMAPALGAHWIVRAHRANGKGSDKDSPPFFAQTVMQRGARARQKTARQREKERKGEMGGSHANRKV